MKDKDKLLNNFIDFKSTMNLDVVFCYETFFNPNINGLEFNNINYTDNEINSLSYKDAIKEDKRTYLQ